MRLLAAALFMFFAATAYGADRDKLVVLSFNAAASDAELARTLGEVVLTELQRANRWDVLGASDVAALIGLERQKQLLGCTDESSSCMSELAGALGARYLVSGSLGRLGETVRLDLKLIDTTTTRALAREGVTTLAAGDLVALTQKAVASMLRTAKGEAPSGTVERASGPRLGPVVVTAAGLSALGGGAVLIASALSFDAAARQQLSYAEAERQLAGARTRYYAGWGLCAAGVATAAIGLIWMMSGDEPAVAVIPAGQGAAFVAIGRF